MPSRLARQRPQSDGRPSEDLSASESDALLGGGRNGDRFAYYPRNCFHRLLSGTIFKSKLKSSEIITLPYNKFYKYFLIVSLLLSGVLFSPDFVPHWLGFFDWRETNLCPAERVQIAENRIHRLARLSDLRWNSARHDFEADCFAKAATAYYGKGWRDRTCQLSQLLKANAQKAKVCVGPTTVSTCSNLSAFKNVVGTVSGICRTVTVPEKCREVPDASRAEELLALERERSDAAILGTHDKHSPDPTLSSPITVSQAAVLNDHGSELVTRLMQDADFGSNAYIIYSALGLIVGTPLILWKRSKRARFLSVVFGMRKNLFIALTVACLTLYDALLLANINFSIVWHAWDDPCGTLDPRVAAAKTNAVMESCSTISRLALNSSRSLSRMDQIYYDVRRYAICQDPVNHHPKEEEMEWIRQRFRNGDLSFRGTCNATVLMSNAAVTEEEEEEEKEERDEFRNKLVGLLFSGVVAQLLVKVVFSSWISHLVALIDPMALHSGKIEIWDASVASDDDSSVDSEAEPLNYRERRSAVRFARDSHLLPVIFLTLALGVQVALIVLSNNIRSLLPDTFKQSQLDAQSYLAETGRYTFQCFVSYP